jgi:hypothetical protein
MHRMHWQEVGSTRIVIGWMEAALAGLRSADQIDAHESHLGSMRIHDADREDS